MSLAAASASALPQEGEPGQQAGLGGNGAEGEPGQQAGLGGQRAWTAGVSGRVEGSGLEQGWERAMHRHLWESRARISEYLCLRGGSRWVFWVILCALVQALHFAASLLSKRLTIDCFYNGFLQNVPSLLLLIAKLFS